MTETCGLQEISRMVIQTRRYTVAEFEQVIALPENQDRYFELIDGEIVEKMPTEEHSVISFG